MKGNLIVCKFMGKTRPVAFILGITNSVDAPARQAFIKDMVGGSDMPSAITLNSMMMNGARVVGPSVSGIMLATVGAGS